MARDGPSGVGPAHRYTPRDVPPLERHDRDRRLRRHGRGDDRRAAPRRAGRAPAGRRVSHPRAERREALEREYGIRTVEGNVEAVEDADVILLGIKPQMLDRVGREIGPHLRRGQLVLSVLAGATTTALTGILGHDQVVRSMPNTPARLGKGMTVWYATPEHDRDPARPGGGPARRPRRPARGRRREDGRHGHRRQRHRPDLRLPGHGGAHRRGRPSRLPAPHRP